MTPTLIIPSGLLALIQREGVSAYPNECCGILFGRDSNAGNHCRRLVEHVEPVANVFDTEEQRHRFAISPQRLMEAEKSAAADDQTVIGFYHSHPDHPARPSEFDRQRAWPFYSYVIVSIVRHDPVAVTSWVLNDSTGQFDHQEIQEPRGGNS